MPLRCTHLDQVRDVEPRTPDGCEECLRDGSWWVHLRLCLTCGHVGCCDQSPNRHATKHFHATDHPIIRSFEPNESWSWCYVEEVILEPEQVDAAIAASTATEGRGNGEPLEGGGAGGLLSRVLAAPYRRNYIVGVIDDPAAAARAAEALRADGIPPGEIVLQSGSEITERLQREDLGALVRDAKTEEGTICRDYDELARGGAILSVYAEAPERVEQAAAILTRHGAHSLKHFDTWTISEVRADTAPA